MKSQSDSVVNVTQWEECLQQTELTVIVVYSFPVPLGKGPRLAYEQHCATIAQWSSLLLIGIYSINLYTFWYYSINALVRYFAYYLLFSCS